MKSIVPVLCLLLPLTISSTGCGAPPAAPQMAFPTQTALGIRVRAVAASMGKLSTTPLATGQVVPWRSSMITPRAPGLVEKRPVDEGSVVSKGTLLLKVDSSRQALALQTAQVALKMRQHDLHWLQSDVARKQALAKKHALSKLELDGAEYQLQSAQLGLEQAQLAVARAKRELRDTMVRAPHAGIVTHVQLGVGEMAAPGRPVMQVVDLSRVRIDVGFSGREVARLRVGDPVIAHLSDLGDQPLQTTVRSISPQTDPRSGLFIVSLQSAPQPMSTQAGVDDAPKVRAGMVATVQLQQEGRPHVLVPRSALVRRQGALSVFVVDAGKARLIPVQIGASDATRTEVLDGVQTGQKVIVSALHALSDGTSVEVEAVSRRDTATPAPGQSEGPP